MALYIYKISQTVNNAYDTYDSAVVIAKDEEAARLIHPGFDGGGDTWCDPEEVEVEAIGTAHPSFTPGAVICASFNAG